MLSVTEKLITAKKCAESLWFFTRYFFKESRGYKFIQNWHHIKMCNALTRVYNGEIKRLIINIPPRYSKTEIGVINFIPWALARNPDSKFIHTSYSKRLAVNNSWRARELIKSDAYQSLFNVSLLEDTQAKEEWYTTQNGGIYAVGSGGSITGFGAGLARKGFGGAIIIDDPHKADEAESDIMRENVIEWFQNTIESRVNSKDTPIIVIMQRLHEEDLSGFLLNGGNGEHWEHICIPALDENDNPLWEYKHSLEDLKRIESANPYVYAGQYMQRPVPKGGGMFKVAEFKFMGELPLTKIVKTIRYWDKAGTEGGGAYTAGVKMSALNDGTYLVHDVVRGQWSADQREKIIKNTAQMDGANVKIWIEREGGSGGKESAENTIKNLAGYAIESEHPTGEKEARARPYASQVNVGNIFLLQGEWNKAYVNELSLFPRGKYKDQVDASAGAFNKLALGKQPNIRVVG